MVDEAPDGRDERRCDFCRMPVPGDPVIAEIEGVEYRFCTAACRDATLDAERVFTEYRGHRRFHSGVSVLDAQLPQGLLRNSFVLLAGQAGTRKEALHAELVWRTLERDEPAIFVSFTEPPTAVVEQFLTLGWNVLPALEAGQLHILDCFTYRVGNRDRMLERMNDWNRHVHGLVAPNTTAVRDPGEVSQVEGKLDACLDEMGMVDTGIVLVDSFTEFGTLLQPIQAYGLVKDVRADVCKGRFVPVIAGATIRSDADEFPHDLEYVVDGVVDMRLNPEIVSDTLIKQIRVRKMNGVLSIPEWTAYEFTAGTGLVMFDPIEEIEKSRAERDGPSDPGEGGEEPGDRSARPADGAGGGDVADGGEGEDGADGA